MCSLVLTCQKPKCTNQEARNNKLPSSGFIILNVFRKLWERHYDPHKNKDGIRYIGHCTNKPYEHDFEAMEHNLAEIIPLKKILFIAIPLPIRARITYLRFLRLSN